MRFATGIGYPVHEVLRRRIDLAGLLTDSCFRSLPDPCGPVAEMFVTSRSFTAAGLSGICTRFPFHFLPGTGNGKPNLRAKIGVNSEKRHTERDYFQKSALRAVERPIFAPEIFRAGRGGERLSGSRASACRRKPSGREMRGHRVQNKNRRQVIH